MRATVFGLSLVLASFSQSAWAQQVSGHADPQDGTFSIRMPNGTLVVADATSQRIYLSGTDGSFTEVLFEQAVAQAEPDPAKRPDLLRSVSSALKDPSAAGAFALPLSIGGFEPDPPPCPDDGANPGGWETECNLQGFRQRGAYSPQNNDDGSGSLAKPTDLEEVTVLGMRPNLIGAGVVYFNDSIGNYENVGGNVSYQQYYADDFKRWQRSRSAACDAASQQAFVFVGMAASTVGACSAAAATGGGMALACAAMVVGTIGSWAQVSSLNQACANGYPGPGNW